ncbi:hypothetical protein SAMN05216228_101059 [Rhizobium tibeticum]|uniref:Uncharacterized protein n=1 Tax=Rhizobium tibeticum TaxID=501024 RepID=A0A1H8L199_9HYPH|nr:hypothetical protein RTCCBAU85039_2700 [Rhizobium tibeticum]SEN98913.1 hypothetical protein SAMN05216228_101059 [Rhizobium tibeticum]
MGTKIDAAMNDAGTHPLRHDKRQRFLPNGKHHFPVCNGNGSAKAACWLTPPLTVARMKFIEPMKPATNTVSGSR